MSVPTIEWRPGQPGYVELIDQTLLPAQYEIKRIRTPEQMWEAIRKLRIRGAPAIGVAAAFGLLLGVQEFGEHDPDDFADELQRTDEYLRSARPTAVNLFWALDRMRAALAPHSGASPAEQIRVLEREACALLEEDKELCRRIGDHGAGLIPEGGGVLTHCNAGGLATADYGTALAVMYSAHRQGRKFRVFADETRPLLQGARLTTWELQRAGIDVTLICDNMAGVVMREGKIQCVIVGADRIARNGDTANKIGTYTVSVLAKEHGIPFYVAAPMSTIDLATAEGSAIPIEERDPDEVAEPCGVRAAPEGVKVYNPAFDVTPHTSVAALITEFGVIERPNEERVVAFFREHRPERLDGESRATGGAN